MNRSQSCVVCPPPTDKHAQTDGQTDREAWTETRSLLLAVSQPPAHIGTTMSSCYNRCVLSTLLSRWHRRCLQTRSEAARNRVIRLARLRKQARLCRRLAVQSLQSVSQSVGQWFGGWRRGCCVRMLCWGICSSTLSWIWIGFTVPVINQSVKLGLLEAEGPSRYSIILTQ